MFELYTTICICLSVVLLLLVLLHRRNEENADLRAQLASKRPPYKRGVVSVGVIQLDALAMADDNRQNTKDQIVSFYNAVQPDALFLDVSVVGQAFFTELQEAGVLFAKGLDVTFIRREVSPKTWSPTA